MGVNIPASIRGLMLSLCPFVSKTNTNKEVLKSAYRYPPPFTPSHLYAIDVRSN